MARQICEVIRAPIAGGPRSQPGCAGSGQAPSGTTYRTYSGVPMTPPRRVSMRPRSGGRHGHSLRNPRGGSKAKSRPRPRIASWWPLAVGLMARANSGPSPQAGTPHKRRRASCGPSPWRPLTGPVPELDCRQAGRMVGNAVRMGMKSRRKKQGWNDKRGEAIENTNIYHRKFIYYLIINLFFISNSILANPVRSRSDPEPVV